MFLKLNLDNNEILATTIDSIPKEHNIFSHKPNYVWTDKKIDNAKLDEGYTAFYDKETDKIYYKEKNVEEPEQTLSEIEQVILDTKLDTEYISCLLEMGLF